jgi:N6-adenosine-specific RNA methylase IME4
MSIDLRHPPYRYTTIVADPPWSYNDKLDSGNTGFGPTGGRIRGAANHYSTMSIEDICALPVEACAAPNAHLYLWTTNAFMVEAHRVVEAWGFTQKTILTWVKPQIGMGWYYRNNTEHVLFAVRGSLRTLNKSQPTSFEARRLRHSEKPDRFYQIVEAMSPGPYLDIFARRERARWDVFGNEVTVAHPLLDLNTEHEPPEQTSGHPEPECDPSSVA